MNKNDIVFEGKLSVLPAGLLRHQITPGGYSLIINGRDTCPYLTLEAANYWRRIIKRYEPGSHVTLRYTPGASDYGGGRGT